MGLADAIISAVVLALTTWLLVRSLRRSAGGCAGCHGGCGKSEARCGDLVRLSRSPPPPGGLAGGPNRGYLGSDPTTTEETP